MLRQDETDKPLIAIWIPEAMEWSMLGSNTEEEGGRRVGVWTQHHRLPPPNHHHHPHTFPRLQKRLEQNN